MATDTERLILSLEAQYRRLQRDMDKANGIAANQTRKIENRFAQTNKAIARSSDQMAQQVARSYQAAAKSALSNTSDIKQALLGSASAIAAGFGVREIANLADGYTRFTNQLKVAGIEGANLTRTQEDLFGVAQKYGVELESLGALYSRLSQSGKDLNANSADLLKFTNGVAAALKVQGGSADSTRGALLQLSQALGGAIVRAEEFNSINEGARPILQAVANGSDRFSGSVTKLRAAVIDGKVTSQEFFQAFLKGSAGLEKQATKATLTISASFTVLNNALGKYIGETDASLSATQRLSQGIGALANNLDTIIPALTVIIGFIGVRYAAAAVTFVASETARQAALVRSTLATEAAAAANAQYALVNLRASATAASMAGSVSAQAVAMGVASGAARTLGASLLAAFGGPIGLTIIALTATIGGLIAIERQAIQATKEYADLATAGDKALRGYENAAYAAATATGEQAKQARAAAATARAEAVEHQKAAQAKLDSAKASLALLKTQAAQSRNTIDAYGGEGSVPSTAGQLRLNDLQQKREAANVKAAEDAVKAAAASIASSDRILNAKPPALATGGESAADKKKRLAAERKAAAEAKKAEAARVSEVRDDKAFDAALRQAQIRLANAKSDSAAVEEERLKLQTESLTAERDLRNKEIAAEGPTGTKRYTDAEVKRLQGLNDQATAQEQANLQTEAQARLQKEVTDRTLSAIQDQADLLGYQRDLATTSAERFALEKRLLALAQEEERVRLQAIVNSKDPGVSAGDRAAAARRLEVLPQIERAQTELLFRDQRDALKDTILGALDAARGGADDFAAYLGDAVKAKLLDSLAQSLADGLIGIGAKAGGDSLKQLGATLLGSLKIPGFASGTGFAPGGLAYVHKNELINLPKGSRVNTAAQTRAMLQGGMKSSRGGGGTTVVADFTGAVVTQDLIDSFNGMVQSAEARATLQGARLGKARTLKQLDQSASRRFGL